MCQCSRNKNQRTGSPGHIILGTDCRKDLIRAAIVFSEFLIKKYDAKSEQGQEKKGPQMCLAVTGHCLQHKRKQSTESSRYTSYHHCQKQPLKQVPHVTSDSSGIIAKFFLRSLPVVFFHIIFVLSCIVVTYSILSPEIIV